jgi:Uma2 family endonuclease
MSTTTEEILTLDEFLAKYGDCSGVELIDGRVVWGGRFTTRPEEADVPKFPHGVTSYSATCVFGDFIRANGLGWVAINDTFVRTKPRSVRGADFLYVSYARLPKTDPPPDLTIPPDLVAEVRSPTDRISQLTDKATEYLRAGVKVVVVIDPSVRTVAVFRDEELPFRLANGDELTLPDVLPGFAVPVARFFE